MMGMLGPVTDFEDVAALPAGATPLVRHLGGFSTSFSWCTNCGAILRRDFAMDTRLVDEGQLHRLLTACFLHNSVFHILFNLGYLQPSCNTWGRRSAQCRLNISALALMVGLYHA